MKTPSLNIGSRSRMFQWFAGLSFLTLCVTSQAQVAFQDDFESGNMNNWAAVGTSPMVIDTNQNKIPINGTYSAHSTLAQDKSYHVIGTEVGTNSAKFTYYLYDSTLTRSYAEVQQRQDGSISSSLNQLIAIGKYNSTTMAGEVWNGAKYQGRIVFGTSVGWFNLDATGSPSRSTGWHKFDLERGVNSDGTVTLNFYVDGILSRSFTDTAAAWASHSASKTNTWNVVEMGFGTSSASNGDAWYDGFKIVDNQPYVSLPPQPQSITQGQDLNLSAQVVGLNNPPTDRLIYQWRKDGLNIAGATNLSFSVTAAQPTNSGTYTLWASNSLGTAISSGALVTVTPLIQITSPPQSTRVNVGETATFTVVASGNGTLTYQWKKDGLNLSGKTDTTLTIPNAQIADRGNYSVYVTNDVHDPGMTSSAAALQVNTAAQVSTATQTVVLSSNPLEIKVPIVDDYSTNGVPFETFESYSTGVTKMFNSPTFSGTTILNLDTNQVSYTRVTNSYPAGHAGNNVLKSTWSWAPAGGAGWLRFTTAGSGASFSPVISTNLTLHFDMFTAKDLPLAFTIRETNPTGALGSSNGGGTGPLELLGVSGNSPPAPILIVPSNSWTKVNFSIPTEVSNFTVITFPGGGGNGIIDSTTGKAVLENLTISTTDGTTPETIYMDNFTIVPADPVTYTLVAGPAGATIDPVTGIISWLPPGIGTYSFTVSVKDTGSFITPDSGLTGTGTFSVNVVNATPSPAKLNYTFSKPNVTMTWTNSSFALQCSDVVTGPWTDIVGATSGFSTNTAAAAKFFRLKY